MILKQSTAASITIGPILDADGVAKTDEVVASILVSKNGGAPAALNGSATLTHRHTGNYTLTLTTGDTDTVGTLEFSLSSTTNAMTIKGCNVVEEAVYVAFFAASATGVPALGALEASVQSVKGYIDTEVATIVNLLEADRYIDTSPTPWQIVLVQKGTGTLGVGTELLRQNLKDTAAANITAITTFIGQQVSP